MPFIAVRITNGTEVAAQHRFPAADEAQIVRDIEGWVRERAGSVRAGDWDGWFLELTDAGGRSQKVRVPWASSSTRPS